MGTPFTSSYTCVLLFIAMVTWEHSNSMKLLTSFETLSLQSKHNPCLIRETELLERKFSEFQERLFTSCVPFSPILLFFLKNFLFLMKSVTKSKLSSLSFLLITCQQDAMKTDIGNSRHIWLWKLMHFDWKKSIFINLK